MIPWMMGTAQQDFPNSMLREIQSGVTYTYRQSYDEADSVFSLMMKNYPDHPAGYILKAGTMQSWIMDYEMEMITPTMDSLLDKGKELASRWSERQPSSAWAHYWLGSAIGYDSYARVYRDEWLSGVTKALSSVSEFKRALELDSSLIDAYTGIGTFQYWRSRKTQILNWVPFVGDQREAGIRNLQRAARDGLFTRYTALNNLLAIMLDAERYEEAVDYAREGLNMVPGNRAFLWGLATAHERKRENRQAIDAYEQLLSALVNAPGENFYNEIVCRLNLVKLKLDEKMLQDVSAHLQRIIQLAHALPPHLQQRGAPKIKEARALLTELKARNALK